MHSSARILKKPHHWYLHLVAVVILLRRASDGQRAHRDVWHTRYALQHV